MSFFFPSSSLQFSLIKVSVWPELLLSFLLPHRQDGNKAQKYFGGECIEEGKCSLTQSGKPLPGAATRPPTSDGRASFTPSPQFQSSWCWCPLDVAHWSVEHWENHKHILQWQHICQLIDGLTANILCGNLARFSTIAPCGIVVADECVSLLRERTDSSKILSPRFGCMYDSACVCLCLCIGRDVRSVFWM